MPQTDNAFVDPHPLPLPGSKVAMLTGSALWGWGHQGQESCAVYGPECLMLPIFRGLRVRVGIHTGLAEEVEVNPVTRRVVYGGKVPCRAHHALLDSSQEGRRPDLTAAVCSNRWPRWPRPWPMPRQVGRLSCQGTRWRRSSPAMTLWPG